MVSVFGTHVTVLNLSNDKTFTYQIVGEDEADVKLGKILCIFNIASFNW